MSQRLCVDWVRYGDGNVYVRVHVQALDNAGGVVAEFDPITLEWLEADVTAKAVANGRADGQWGNMEITQLLLADQIPAGLTVIVPGVPAQPAVVNQATGEIIRPAIEAVGPTMRLPGLRFDNISTVVWAQTA